jgi:HlyD family secretion protein
MRRSIWLAVLVLIAAGAGALARGSMSDEGRTPAAAPTSANAGLIVGAGRVESISEELEISAELPGRLRAVLVDEGSEVRKGDVVAEIESAEYVARLAAARASAARAHAELERIVNGARREERDEARAAVAQAAAVLAQAKTEVVRREALFRDGAISREELERTDRDLRVAQARHDELVERQRLIDSDARHEDVDRARAAVAAAEASVSEARAMLEKTRVRAPIDGVILRRHLLGGESVAVSSTPEPIVSMADLSQLRVRMDVDETDIADVRLGQRAWVTADAFGSRQFPGRVVRIGSMLGRKNVRTDAPAERQDTKVLETLIALEPGHPLPVGLRVDAFIAKTP